MVLRNFRIWKSEILKIWKSEIWKSEIWKSEILKSEIFKIWNFENLKSEIWKFHPPTYRWGKISQPTSNKRICTPTSYISVVRVKDGVKETISSAEGRRKIPLKKKSEIVKPQNLGFWKSNKYKICKKKWKVKNLWKQCFCFHHSNYFLKKGKTTYIY